MRQRKRNQSTHDGAADFKEVTKYTSCQRGINDIQEHIVTRIRAHQTKIKRVVYVALTLLYFSYFAYSMYYRFGDEGSIRLLVVTVLLVFLAVIYLTRFIIKCPFVRCCGALANDGKRKVIRWFLYVAAVIVIGIILVVDVALQEPQNLLSLLGLAAFVVCCFVCSTNPSKVNWHPVFWGLALQFFFAAIILRTQLGYEVFTWLGDRVTEFLAHTDAGSAFVFGNISDHFFVFGVFPVVVFFSAFISVTYYLGIMQAVVTVLGRFLSLCLGTTPAESLNAAGNIFLSMTESPLMIKPYLETMTISELHAVMTGGFATIAGGVLGAYIGFGIPANHLLSASVMSAPAALAISKLMCPETEMIKTSSEDCYRTSKGNARNLVEAASEGATISIRLIVTIIVNLIAFLAILEFVNATLDWLGERVGVEGVSFQFICSYVLYPVALFMGTPSNDCRTVAELVGVKTFTNEFIAYRSLQVLLENRKIFVNYTQTYNNTEWYWEGQDVVLANWNTTLKKGFMETEYVGFMSLSINELYKQERSEVISTYALCGFSNIGSMGILLGGLSALAPSRKSDLSGIVARAMIAGNVACFFTACIAGLFFKEF